MLRRFGQVKQNVSADEIVELRFLAEHSFYGPKFLERLVERVLRLRAAIVWTVNGGFVIDARRDKGFADAFDWFGEHGWDTGEGQQLAFLTPLVRATVPKRLE